MTVWGKQLFLTEWVLWCAAAAKPTRPRAATVSGISDADLVKGALNGDKRSREQLYRRHGPLVVNTVGRLLGSKQDVPDLVQDIFLYAYRQLHTLREPKKFKSWLMQIAVNQVRMSIRKRRTRRRYGVDATAEDASLRALAPEEWSPEIRAQLSMIDDILRSLPEEQRIAWQLRHVEGYTMQEVADLGGWSLSSAKRYVKAAQASISERVAYPSDPEGHDG